MAESGHVSPVLTSDWRRSGRGLSRASAQDIPDIYWEQAARELDFCTCRKCQVSGGVMCDV